MRISTRIQSLLVSAALLVPLVATPVTAAYAQPTEEKTAASWSGVVINEAYLSGGQQGRRIQEQIHRTVQHHRQ